MTNVHTTEQIEAERARAQALFASIGEGAITTNEEGRIERINSHAEKMLRLSAKEAIGEWFPKVIVAEDVDGKLIGNIDRPILKALLQGKPISAKTVYRRKDGTKLPVFITVSPILLNGLPIGAIQVFRDITEENEIEKAKDEFLSLASHQLRTPATAVKQFLGLIVEGFVSDEKEKNMFIKDAYESNDEQLQIIDDILSVAKIDAGKLELKTEPVDMIEVVKHAVAELQGLASTKAHTLSLHHPERKVPLIIDKLKITMSIQNLISNALKYTPDHGKVTVTMNDLEHKVTISVQDTGIGIAKADQVTLFSKFGRIQTDLTAKVQGTGLGLYLVKQFVEMHGGNVNVASTPGQGTTFTIELPKEK